MLRPATLLLLALLVSACSLMPPENERLRVHRMENAVLPIAGSALAAGQVETARRLYRRLLELDPDSVQARMGLGDVATRERASASAAQWYLAALSHAEQPAERQAALLAHGRAALADGQLDAAKQSFSRLTDPGESAGQLGVAWGHNGVGLTLLLEGNIRAAVAEMEKAVLHAPDEERFQGNLNRALAILDPLQSTDRGSRNSVNAGVSPTGNWPAGRIEEPVSARSPPEQPVAAETVDALQPLDDSGESEDGDEADIPPLAVATPHSRDSPDKLDGQLYAREAPSGAAELHEPPTDVGDVPESTVVAEDSEPLLIDEEEIPLQAVTAKPVPSDNSPALADATPEAAVASGADDVSASLPPADDDAPIQIDVATTTSAEESASPASTPDDPREQTVGMLDDPTTAEATPPSLDGVADFSRTDTVLPEVHDAPLEDVLADAADPRVTEEPLPDAQLGYLPDAYAEDAVPDAQSGHTPAAYADLPENDAYADLPENEVSEDIDASTVASEHPTEPTGPESLPRAFAVTEGNARFIQFGAYAKRANAENVAEHLRLATDQPVSIAATADTAGLALNRVRIGPFHIEQQLLASMDDLELQGYRIARPAPLSTDHSNPFSGMSRPTKALLVLDDGERYLQAGAYRERPTAETIAGELRGLTEQPVRVTPVEQEDSPPLYRVRVGPLVWDDPLIELFGLDAASP